MEPTAGREMSPEFSSRLRKKWTRWLDAPPLRERELKRYILLALVYRAISLLLTLSYTAEAAGDVTRHIDLVFVVVGVLFAVNVGLILAVVRREAGWFADSVPLRVADLGSIVVLQLWSAFIVVEGTLFLPYRDILWIYAVATVALWTGVRQSRAGLLLLAASIPLQVAMGLVNKVAISEIASGQFLAREGWLVLGFVVGSFHISIAREARDAARAAGRRAGREAERAKALRELHDTSLQTLDGIALRAELDHVDPLISLQEIGAEARRRAAQVRVLLRRSVDEPAGLYASLDEVVAEVEGRGAIVPQFVPVGVEPALDEDVRTALAGAVREAVRNAERHAEAKSVTIFLESDGGKIRVTIRDDGSGFDAAAVRADAFGMRESIRGRLADVGASATLLTAANGQGTTWEFTAPIVGQHTKSEAAETG